MARWFLWSILISILVTTASAQDIDPKKDYLVNIRTDYGLIKVILYDATPLHKANFIKLAQDGFYDGLLFHRVIDNFMIQGGDPDSRTARPEQLLGNGDVGYTIPAEFRTDIFHKKGVIAAARDDNPDKASSGCQFYLVEGMPRSESELDGLEARKGYQFPQRHRQVYTTLGGTPHLDQDYTVFGEIVYGMDVLEEIAAIPTDDFDRPKEDVQMTITLKEVSRKKLFRLYGINPPQE